MSLDYHIFYKASCYSDSKIHGANMGPTWVLSAPDGPHVGPMNLAIREYTYNQAAGQINAASPVLLHCNIFERIVSQPNIAISPVWEFLFWRWDNSTTIYLHNRIP